jgi:hypothetical protein
VVRLATDLSWPRGHPRFMQTNKQWRE